MLISNKINKRTKIAHKLQYFLQLLHIKNRKVGKKSTYPPLRVKNIRYATLPICKSIIVDSLTMIERNLFLVRILRDKRATIEILEYIKTSSYKNKEIGVA